MPNGSTLGDASRSPRPPRVGRLETQASLHQADCVGHTGSFQMLYGGCSAKRESILMPFPFMLQCYSRGMSARSTDLHTSPRQACMLTCALRRACMLQPGVRLQRSRVAAAHGARDSVTSHGVTAVARAEARAAASARAAARAAAAWTRAAAVRAASRAAARAAVSRTAAMTAAARPASRASNCGRRLRIEPSCQRRACGARYGFEAPPAHRRRRGGTCPTPRDAGRPTAARAIGRRPRPAGRQ